MKRLAETLGLQASSRVHAGGRRWFIPLTRRSAGALRREIEGRTDHERRRYFEVETDGLGLGIECLALRRGRDHVRYVLGGEFAALRRILVIDTDAELELALDRLGLNTWLRSPNAEEEARHRRASALLRTHPQRVAAWWVDGESWPPETDALASAGETADESPSKDAPQLAHRLVGSGQLLALEVLVSNADAVRSMLEEGLVPARWRYLNEEPTSGLSPERDLRSGGASFVFARLLTPDRMGQPLPDGIDYVVWLDAELLDREDRFILREERYGSLHALSDAVSDPSLEQQLTEGRWPIHHELLFTQPLQAAGIIGVQCRDETARTRLCTLGWPESPPLTVGSVRRPPSSFRA